jgi:hypothetical protein
MEKINKASMKVDYKLRNSIKSNNCIRKIFHYSKGVGRLIILLNKQQYLNSPDDKLSTANLQLIQLLRSQCDRYDSMVNKNIHLKNGDRKTHYDIFYSNMSFSLNCFDWDDPNLGKFLDKLSHFQ